jgi:hypothetical protein
MSTTMFLDSVHHSSFLKKPHVRSFVVLTSSSKQKSHCPELQTVETVPVDTAKYVSCSLNDKRTAHF